LSDEESKKCDICNGEGAYRAVVCDGPTGLPEFRRIVNIEPPATAAVVKVHCWKCGGTGEVTGDG
jgi:DnaJ-class molecular chaperone